MSLRMAYADPAVYRRYQPDELGADGYPPVWHERVKHEVREHAEHRCVRCLHPYRRGEHGRGEWSPCDERCTHRGPVRLAYTADDGSEVRGLEHLLATQAGVVVGYGKLVEAQWRILTVHHLTGDKADLRWWNLASLCQRCHLRIQHVVQMERVWPWPHTQWFRLHVAGYYAATYLGEDLGPAEVQKRLPELLALERVQESL